MQPSPQTTLAIIIGASEYPRAPRLSKEAFRRSAEAFKNYLIDEDGFGLSSVNLLDLFDSIDAPSTQEDRITSFLASRITQMTESKMPATDLIVYYVGHGTFVDPGNRYVLALKDIKEGSEDISGLPIRTLANAIRKHSQDLRRFMILDCCFSAAAFDSFQGIGPLEVARQNTTQYLPVTGTALLCASGARDPAKAPANLEYTQFSTALLEVLKTGGKELPEKFSLGDLGLRVETLLTEKYKDEAVRPQVLSPDQSVGDIAKLPIFPNLGLRAKSLSNDLAVLQEAMTRLESVVSTLTKSQGDLASQQRAMETRLDALSQSTTDAFANRSIPVASAQASADDSEDEVVLYRFPRLITTGVPKALWAELPPRIKREIIRYKRSTRNGFIWAVVSVAIASDTWLLTIWPFLSASGLNPVYRILSRVSIGVCGFMSIAHLWATLQKRLFRTLSSEEGEGPGWWDKLDVVIEAKSYLWRNVFGLELEKNAFSVAQLVYLLTFLGTLTISLLLRFGIY